MDAVLRLVLRALLFIGRTIGWLVPTVGAIVALGGLMFWVMGIPGSSTPDYYRDWLLGLLVLGGFLGLYGLYVVLAVVGKLSKQPVILYSATAGIWIASILTLSIMQGIWTRLSLA